MKSEHTFELQVLPSQELTHVAIITRRTGFTCEVQATLDVVELRRLVREKSPAVIGESVVFDRYEVNVVRGDGQDSTGYRHRFRSFLNKEEGAPIGGATFNLAGLKGARVVVSIVTRMELNREIAIRVYEQGVRTDLPANVKFRVSIYTGEKSEREALDKYLDFVESENEKLLEPLDLASPIARDSTGQSEVHYDDKIVFLAKRKDSDEIIGYCACVLLLYDDENGQQQTIIDRLLEEDPDSESRYFTGVKPRSLFEIEGLSGSPGEKDSNLGVILIYEAMRFITSEVIKPYFPVTHIVANSASVITKYLLTFYFKFHYLGANRFMNESFVETLRNNAEDSGVSALVATLVDMTTSFYTLANTPTTLLKDQVNETFFTQKVDSVDANVKRSTTKNPVKLLIDAVINIYHLFFLIAKSTLSFQHDEKKRIDSRPLAESLEKMFKFMSDDLLFDASKIVLKTIKRYFELNRTALRAYIDSGCTDFDSLEKHIYVKKINFSTSGKVLKWDIPLKLEGYGFLGKVVSIDRITKVTYREGYDVIFKAIRTMAYINKFLSSDCIVHEKAFDLSRLCIKKDIELDFNYIIPDQQAENATDTILENQLGKIYDVLSDIKREGTLSKKAADIDDLLLQIQRKRALMKSNAKINKLLMTEVYNLPPDSMVDTIISFKSLETEWSDIDRIILEKISATKPTSLPQQQPIQEIVVGDDFEHIDRTPIAIPEDRNSIYEDMLDIVLGPIFSNKHDDALVFFKGKLRRLSDIKQYYVVLLHMKDRPVPNEEVGGAIIVEEPSVKTAYVCDVKEFIDTIPSIQQQQQQQQHNEMDVEGDFDVMNMDLI